MTDDVDDKLTEIRKEESRGNRLERDDPQAQPGFVEEIEAALKAISSGEVSDTITAYDPNLAAVLHALEEDEQMEEVFDQLNIAYEGESGLKTPSRSAIIRLAVRVGLQEGTDGVLADLEEALNRRETTTV